MTMPISTHHLSGAALAAGVQYKPKAGRAVAGSLTALLCAATLAGCGGPHIGGYGAPSAAALMQAQQNDEEKAKAAKPDTRELYLSMIRQMQEQGSYFASLAHIDQFRIQYGSAPDVDILRADALRETGQPDAAEQAYRTLLSGNEAAAAWHGVGLVAAQRKDYAGAAQSLREAVSRAPTEAFYLSDLGFALLNNGDTGAARVPLAQAAELRPDSRKVLSNLAVYLVVTGERSRADDMMTRAKMPQATRDAIDKLAADIRAQGKARRAAAAHAAAQAAATIAPPMSAAATAQGGAGSAVVAGAAGGPVVVRLTSGSEPGTGQTKTQVKAAAADATLARASDAARSDMPTSMLDRFGHSQ
ncbi:Flp pilus assembly protein [Pandoraea communis]|uniref:Flp pilus assembly protein n=2 Tax=Pandoraea communis TaxID=2508297 RepID=A0A5E4TPN9_9BURK|nr:Flp pilus assembly protein [Pandoraea communis]